MHGSNIPNIHIVMYAHIYCIFKKTNKLIIKCIIHTGITIVKISMSMQYVTIYALSVYGKGCVCAGMHGQEIIIQI